MQKFMIFLSVITTLFIINNVIGGEIDKTLHENCLHPTIYVGQANGKGGFGSGVIVRSEKVKDNLYKNIFLTCAHITTPLVQSYEVRQYIYEDGIQVKQVKSYPAVFFSYNNELDIAIGLFLSEELMPVAKLNFDPKIFIGNEVFRIGCGLGDDPRLDYGKLTTYKKNSNKPLMRTSVMTVSGDSGGPLFHENKVIGIMVSVRANKNGQLNSISYAVPLDRFKQWNKANDNNLNFAWTTDKLPELHYMYLQFKDYTIK